MLVTAYWRILVVQLVALLMEIGLTSGQQCDLPFVKRAIVSDNQSPSCTCSGRPVLADMGRHHFPRFLATMDCESSRCWYRPYSCKPRIYKVKVLKRKSEDEVALRDASLPENLRSSWKFVPVPITVACVCDL